MRKSSLSSRRKSFTRSGSLEHRLQVVAAIAAPVVEAGGQRLGDPHREVDQRGGAHLGRERARQPEHAQRQERGGLGELERVRAHQRAAVHVLERGGHLLVDHPHHLLGGHAVGREGGHEGAGARAHVDVELVHGPVDREQVERPQRADLVDPAGEATAAEHQRGARAPRLAPARLALRPLVLPCRLLEPDYVAHPGPDYALDRSVARRYRVRFPRCVVSPSSSSSCSRPRRRRPPRTRPDQPPGPPDARGRRLFRRLRGQPDHGRDACSAGARTRARILASNTKLFTTSAALARFGTEGTLGTEVRGTRRAASRRRLARRPVSARRRRPHLRQPQLRHALLRRAGRAPSRSWPRCSRRPASSA